MRADIVGIGYPCLDIIVRIPRLPESGTTVPIERYLYQGGGTVSTALAAASALGASAGIIGLVADDSAGRFCLQDFRLNGVATDHLAVDPASATAVNFCLSESEKKQRSFLSYEAVCRALRPEEIDGAYIAQAKWLHLARMDEISVAAARIARENGVRVMLDADLYDPRTRQYSPLIDALIASEEYYLGRFPGGAYEENLRRIRAEGPSIAVVTLGERGCVALGEDGFHSVPAFQGNPVVDTTGAGDVFHGAFLYGLTQRWDIETMLRFSSAAAAIKCTRLGGRTGIPDRKTVDRFLATGAIDQAYMDAREAAYRRMKYA